MIIRESDDLLAAAKEKNPEAYIAIFDQFAPAIYRYALNLSADPITADNIVGDVFAKMLEQFEAGNGPNTNLQSYLFQSVYHAVVDGSRVSRRTAPLELAIESRDPKNFVDLLENKIAMEVVMAAINSELTNDQRHVIILRFMEDFSIKETAKIMGIEVNHVKVLQNRGVAKLQKVLGVRA